MFQILYMKKNIYIYIMRVLLFIELKILFIRIYYWNFYITGDTYKKTYLSKHGMEDALPYSHEETVIGPFTIRSTLSINSIRYFWWFQIEVISLYTIFFLYFG